MFQSNKPTFGQPATSNTFGGGFTSGTSATPFGQSAFGKPATSSFAAPAFGSTGTSLFGQSAPATGGLFGGASATPVFGQTQTAQPSAFGSFQTPSTSNSLFGAQQNVGTGLFGASTSTSSAFGAAKPAFGGFGATQTSGGLFGQQPQQSQAAPSLFGQTTQQTSSGLFGSSGFGGAGTATQATGTVIKFTPVTGTDTMVKNGSTQTISTRHHCITCMKEYENKSLEELRLEDYMANRKGPQAGSQQAGGLFGSGQQPSLFGAVPSAGGAPSGGLFGDNKSMFGAGTSMGGFGGQTTSVFGQQAQTGTSMFGKPTGFGAATTAAATGSGFSFSTAAAPNPFGQTAAVKPFGAVAPQTNTMFGAGATQPSTGFGAQTTGFGSGFGTQPTQGLGMFGQQAKAPFGGLATTSSGFGGFGTAPTATTTGSLFGAKPAATTGFGSGFGTTPAPAFGSSGTMFGQTQPTTSLFSQQFNKPANTGFSFGQTATSSAPGLGTGLSLGGGTGMFGSTAAKPTGGLFGSGTGGMFGSGGGGFGSGASAFPSGSGFGGNLMLGGGSSQMMGGGTGFMGQAAAQPNMSHQQILALASMPYGDSSLFKDLLPSTGRLDELLKPTNPAAQKAALLSSQFKVSPRPTGKLKTKPVVASALSKKSLFDGIYEEEKIDTEKFVPRNNYRRLNLKPPAPFESSVQTQPPPATTSASAVSIAATSTTEDHNDSVDGNNSWLRTVADMRPVKDLEGVIRRPDAMSRHPIAELDNTMADLARNSAQPPPPPPATAANPTASDAGEGVANGSLDVSVAAEPDEEPSIMEGQPSHPSGIVLRRTGYYTIPSLDEISGLMADDGSCVIDNFTVGRMGYGNVFFPDSFDVADLNLDEIVHFRHKEVTLYPDDDRKPPVGEGLNRRAQVTLDRVWPTDKTTHLPITEPDRLAQMKYEDNLQRVCSKLGARFKEYRPQTGSWVFNVDHFSKYGVDDSEDDEPLPTDIKKLKLTSALGTSGMPGTSGTTYGVTPVTSKPVTQLHPRAPLALYLEEDESMQVSEPHLQSSHLQQSHLQPPLHQSPTMRLAHDIVTSSHKVQLMKASFFDDEHSHQDIETVDKLEEMSNYQYFEDAERMHPEQLPPTKLPKSFSLFRTQFAAPSPRPPAEEVAPLQRKQLVAFTQSRLPLPSPLPPPMPPLVDKPVVEVLKYGKGEVARTSESLFWKYAVLADIAKPFDMILVKGNSFKARFGPATTLLSLNTRQAASSMPLCGDWTDTGDFLRGRGEGDRSADVVQRIRLPGGRIDDTEVFKDTVLEHLQVQLDHCVFGMDENCPAVGPSCGVEALHAHCVIGQQLAASMERDSLINYAGRVWELCVALWGNQADLGPDYKEDRHHEAMVRRSAVSDWLESAVRLACDSDMADARINVACDPDALPQLHVRHMLSLLSANRVMEACNLAQKHGDHYAALLLSQVRSGSAARQLMKQQLAAWLEAEADRFVERERLKLLMLVAGLPLLPTSNHGTVNVCEGLDWLRAFAMELWFLGSAVSSVSDALLRYEEAFGLSIPENAYSVRPEPPYAADTNGLMSSGGRPTYDLCYHLLSLYGNKTHSLDALLNPATHSEDPFDYRLSWFLQQSLLALGYSHTSHLSSAIMHTNFANQLESHGLWHWAVFVLLHLKHGNSRRSAVLDLLGRHVTLSTDQEHLEREDFLVERLHVPPEWIFQAKATRAMALGRHQEAASLLIDAGKWNESHRLIMDHIAADAIINEKNTELADLLAALEPPERSSTIAGWSNGGQLLWDFLKVMADVKALLANRELADGYRFEKLNPQLTSLCARVHLLPCHTPVHTMCQAHIAKVTASLVQTYLSLQCDDHRVYSQNLARLVKQLPLPEDSAQELLNVVSKKLNQVT